MSSAFSHRDRGPDKGFAQPGREPAVEIVEKVGSEPYPIRGHFILLVDYALLTQRYGV